MRDYLFMNVQWDTPRFVASLHQSGAADCQDIDNGWILSEQASPILIIKAKRMCGQCSGYRRWNWNLRAEFKFRSILFHSLRNYAFGNGTSPFSSCYVLNNRVNWALLNWVATSLKKENSELKIIRLSCPRHTRATRAAVLCGTHTTIMSYGSRDLMRWTYAFLYIDIFKICILMFNDIRLVRYNTKYVNPRKEQSLVVLVYETRLLTIVPLMILKYMIITVKTEGSE